MVVFAVIDDSCTAAFAHALAAPAHFAHAAGVRNDVASVCVICNSRNKIQALSLIPNISDQRLEFCSFYDCQHKLLYPQIKLNSISEKNRSIKLIIFCSQSFCFSATADAMHEIEAKGFYTRPQMRKPCLKNRALGMFESAVKTASVFLCFYCNCLPMVQAH